MKKNFLLIGFLMSLALPGYTSDIFDSSVFINLDYGLYWAGANNSYEKASSDTANGSAFYDPEKPTLIYIHGWKPDTVINQERNLFYDASSGRPDVDLAALWRDNGYNIGIIYWNQFADESEVEDAEAKIWTTEGDKGMRWLDSEGNYHYGDVDKPITELLIENYLQAMAKYRGNDIRFAGHSLGSQVALRMAYLLNQAAENGQIEENLVPERISLLEAFFSNGDKSYLDYQYTGEVAREIVDSLKEKNTAIDAYRTSSASASIFVGDENIKLNRAVAFVEQKTYYFYFYQQAQKHTAASWLYLWSIAFPTPSVDANILLAAPSAAASNDLIRTWMDADKSLSQSAGYYSKDPGDDAYELKNRI